MKPTKISKVPLVGISSVPHLVRYDPKLPDDNGEVPKSKRRDWQFDSWM